MFRSSFFWKLYAGYVALVVLTAVIIGVLVGRRIERDPLNEIGQDLNVKALILRYISEKALAGAPDDMFESRITELGNEIQTRLTVIKTDGTVIADSEESPSAMENHGTRPEILDARDRGMGQATGFSDTMDREMMYFARPVIENENLLGYVRTSLPLTMVCERLGHVRKIGVLGGIIAGLATNIAEDVVFMVEGELMRHGIDEYRKKDAEPS